MVPLFFYLFSLLFCILFLKACFASVITVYSVSNIPWDLFHIDISQKAHRKHLETKSDRAKVLFDKFKMGQ